VSFLLFGGVWFVGLLVVGRGCWSGWFVVVFFASNQFGLFFVLGFLFRCFF